MIRTPEDEARSPRYAHVERERRWLIDPSCCPPLHDDDGTWIEDRYLVDARLRLRRMRDRTGRVSFKLTKKYESDDPLARAIVTTYLDEAEYRLLEALPGAVLVKYRLPFAVDGHVYALDRFAGKLQGLILAEIEWSDDIGLQAIPAPFAAAREVTADPRYGGGNLAVHGIPKD